MTSLRVCIQCWLCLAACLLAPALSPAFEPQPTSESSDTGYLVQFRAGTEVRDAEAVLRSYGFRIRSRLAVLEVYVVQPDRGQPALDTRALSADPRVVFVEPDRLVSVQGAPDDPRYAEQWHLPKIGAPLAWDGSRGEGVIVAVVDTGVDPSHPDLAGNLVAGWNVLDGTADTSDANGHGTHVAGVIAAITDNATGVASVAPLAGIMPVRVADASGSAFTRTIAAGITWAADHGASVVNASLGALNGSPTIQAAAEYLRGKGGLLVVAAGNTGTQLPGSDDSSLIAVSATTSTDQRWSGSSYGDYVDLSAPGAGIVTTARGGAYATVSGTSFASPCAAGVLALMKAAAQDLSPAEVETILFQTADDLGAVGWDPQFGHGRVNAAAAVFAAATRVNHPPAADAGVWQTVTEGTRVTLDGSGSTDPEDGTSLSFSWIQSAGPAVALSGATTAAPSFTSPAVGPAGATLEFTLTVTDSGNLTDEASVAIQVNDSNEAPSAGAGPGQTVAEGTRVTLDGSGSTDPEDGTNLAFAWIQSAGPTVALSGAATAAPSFTAPAVGPAGTTLEFTLTVTDSRNLTATATVRVQIMNVNAAPAADAGKDQTVSEGTMVALDGSGSSDPDGTTLTFRWAQEGGPPAPLMGSNGPSPTFVAPEVDASASALVFVLRVSDGELEDEAFVEIRVTDDIGVADPGIKPQGDGGGGGGGCFLRTLRWPGAEAAAGGLPVVANSLPRDGALSD